MRVILCPAQRRLGALALRGRRRDLCRSSVAGGIGGLGFRAERRTQRTILHVDALGLRGLCEAALLRAALCPGRRPLLFGLDVEGDCRHRAVFAALAGHLAFTKGEGEREGKEWEGEEREMRDEISRDSKHFFF